MIVFMAMMLRYKPLKAGAFVAVMMIRAIVMTVGFKCMNGMAQRIVVMAMWHKIMHQHTNVGKQYRNYS